ncbi:hypothetical protein D3C81_1618090 [compost metagenome]
MQTTGRTLLTEHQLPVTETHGDKLAIVVEVVEFFTCTLVGFTGQVIQLIEPIQVHLEVLAAHIGTLEQTLFDVRIADCGQ